MRTSEQELRAFHVAVGLVLIIPGVAGPVAGFLGIDALATLLHTDAPHIPAALQNSLRAVGWMFATVVPITVWSLRRMPERAAAFQIVVCCGFVAGLTRVTGFLCDGYPGLVPLGIMAIELGFMPVLLVWHRSLVRRIGARP